MVGAHVLGAILFLGGAIAAGAFNLAAQNADRPSEIVRSFKRTRLTLIPIGIGALLALVLGLLLVHREGYSFGQAWIVVSLVLYGLALLAGAVGGRRDRHTRELAERLAADGDAPSAELKARLRDPVSLTLSYGGGLAVIAIFVLMLTKPGS
jgi:uncharacterized membrane protein